MGSLRAVSWLNGSEQDRPWFHIRSYGVGTSELVAGASVAMMFVFAIAPSVVYSLALQPAAVLRGSVWQLVTWPLVNAPSFWTLWNAVVLWFTGRTIERELGKGRFGWLLLAITVGQSILAVLLSLAFGVNSPILAGIGTLSLILVLLFIAENPKMPFFFGIPAWVFGVIMVVIPLLTYIAARAWLDLLLLALSLVLSAIVAKFAGLLGQYSFIPGRPVTGRPRVRKARTPRSYSQGPTVVQGPWSAYEPPSASDAEMDALLDKIMAGGLDSLTPKERKRLEELRQQRRSR